MSTIKDVAKRAGVSVSTVYKVFSDNYSTRPGIKERVLEACKEVNYVHHAVVRNRKLLGLMFSEAKNPFTNDLIQMIIEELGNEYEIVVLFSNEDTDREAQNVACLERLGVDALIFAAVSNYNYPEIEKMSLDVIKKLNAAGIKCTVLTKGILPVSLAECSKENEYGITLISLDEEYRERMEPGSASYKDRLKALKKLHDKGCKTWVSIEPYPTPNLIEQDVMEILKSVSFVDKIIFGRTNYCKDVTTGYPEHKQFYNEKAKEVIDFCEKKGIAYHIKDKTITDWSPYYGTVYSIELRCRSV